MLLSVYPTLHHGDLPDSSGPLLSMIPTTAIVEANAAASTIRNEVAEVKEKRRPFIKVSGKIRAKIGKTHSFENGDSSGTIFHSGFGQAYLSEYHLWYEERTFKSYHARGVPKRI